MGSVLRDVADRMIAAFLVYLAIKYDYGNREITERYDDILERM